MQGPTNACLLQHRWRAASAAERAAHWAVDQSRVPHWQQLLGRQLHPARLLAADAVADAVAGQRLRQLSVDAWLLVLLLVLRGVLRLQLLLLLHKGRQLVEVRCIEGRLLLLPLLQLLPLLPLLQQLQVHGVLLHGCQRRGALPLLLLSSSSRSGSGLLLPCQQGLLLLALLLSQERLLVLLCEQQGILLAMIMRGSCCGRLVLTVGERLLLLVLPGGQQGLLLLLLGSQQGLVLSLLCGCRSRSMLLLAQLQGRQNGCMRCRVGRGKRGSSCWGHARQNSGQLCLLVQGWRLLLRLLLHLLHRGQCGTLIQLRSLWRSRQSDVWH